MRIPTSNTIAWAVVFFVAILVVTIGFVISRALGVIAIVFCGALICIFGREDDLPRGL
jgi:hypothetical protein